MPRPQPVHRALPAFALAGLLACGNAPHGRPADLVVYGRIWTGDSAAPWAAALAIKADLVLLDQDLTRIAPEAIERVAVQATVVGGHVVYQAK
jgi:predicted amidohydrolase YtcJ